MLACNISDNIRAAILIPYCRLGGTKTLFIVLLIIKQFCVDVLFVGQPNISWECASSFKIGKYGHMSLDFKEIVQSKSLISKIGIIRVLLHTASLFEVKRDKACIEHSTVPRI